MSRRRDLIETTTFCTGYWRIPGNTKRSEDHYTSRVAGLGELIRGGRLVVFHDDDAVLDRFARAGTAYDVRVEGRRVAIADLPTHAQGARLLAGCRAMAGAQRSRPAKRERDKGVAHYWRDYVDGGPEVYRRLATIWTSKIALVLRHGIGRDAAPSARYAWIDASIARFNGRRTGWDFTRVAHRSDAVSHYRSAMRCRGRRLPINASLLLAPATLWPVVHAFFEQALEEAVDEAYAHDEETVLARCHAARPALFHAIGAPVHGLRRQLMRLNDLARRTAW